MSTGTIIRVKRRLNDDPVDALVLSFKRKKTEESGAEEESAVLKFAGTSLKKDNSDIGTIVQKVQTKSELIEYYKTHAIDVSSRQRQEQQRRSKENRFRVLSLHRLDTSSDETAGPFTIVDVDIETEYPVEDTQPVSTPIQYVYDIYANEYLHEDDYHETYMESLLSVQPLCTPMEYRNSEDLDEVDPYEEDSNDEDNYRNDYPDSDHSINEDDMRLAANLRGMGIDDGFDLSSDEENLYLAMSGLTPGSYDEYKARVMRDMEGYSGDEHSSDSSDCGDCDVDGDHDDD